MPRKSKSSSKKGETYESMIVKLDHAQALAKKNLSSDSTELVVQLRGNVEVNDHKPSALLRLAGKSMILRGAVQRTALLYSVKLDHPTGGGEDEGDTPAVLFTFRAGAALADLSGARVSVVPSQKELEFGEKGAE